MGLSTAFTDLFAVQHPIASAPMGGSAGGALTAAVSNGGGLGLLGSGNGDPAWLERELRIVADRTDRPWGIGFLTWAVDVAAVEHALTSRPSAVMLSFGDPSAFVAPVRRAGAALILQVTDLAEARQAVRLGADVIVARFQATTEALVDPAISKAIVEGRGEDTERNRVLDIARRSPWPANYHARTLAHPYLEQWRGRGDELAADDGAQRAYQDAVAQGQFPPLPVWAGEAVDLITDLPSATGLVAALAAQAEAALARAGKR